MFDRPSSGSGAVLVGLDVGQSDYAESLDEARELATSAGLTTLAVVKGRRLKPDAAYFAGRGKVDEIRDAVTDTGAQVVLFNHQLSPVQERNLEQQIHCRVVDRTSLILDIFAQRARSHEGKVQVELAQLQHLSTRLVRGWTHLERQKGGIGMRGPGETQLETDRRLLGKRVKLLKEKLARIQSQRAVQRRARARNNLCAVSLVGYTNAGKSTLFNRLASASTYAADKLFATLDTTTRRIVANGAPVLLSDTVGFIRQLPHSLVAAFRATLEETAQADVLLHVVDASSEDRDAQVEAVNTVLKEIGGDGIPQILVYNKVDLTPIEPRVERDEYGKICRVWLSARTGKGLDGLRSALHEHASLLHTTANAPEDALEDAPDDNPDNTHNPAVS
jgi:GTP-binding protein HflX